MPKKKKNPLKSSSSKKSESEISTTKEEKDIPEGYKKLNLGGITNPNIIEGNNYKGLNNFKLNFNAISYEYLGDLELVCNETLYFLYKGVPLKNILKI